MKSHGRNVKNYWEIKEQAIAEISKDIGQIFFASVVIGPIVENRANLFTFIIGMIIAGFCWLLYTYLIKTN